MIYKLNLKFVKMLRKNFKNHQWVILNLKTVDIFATKCEIEPLSFLKV